MGIASGKHALLAHLGLEALERGRAPPETAV